MSKRLSAYLCRMNDDGAIYHYCPACKNNHPYAVDFPFFNGALWDWNRNVEKPTFTPDMVIQVAGSAGWHTCRYAITNGKIAYSSDCTHAFAGQVVDLPEMPLCYMAHEGNA